MPSPIIKPAYHFTEAARKAAAEALRAKREAPDTFGQPEMFIIRVGSRNLTWELRGFGGVLLERGTEAFASPALARADGKAALATLCAARDLPTFKRPKR